MIGPVGYWFSKLTLYSLNTALCRTLLPLKRVFPQILNMNSLDRILEHKILKGDIVMLQGHGRTIEAISLQWWPAVVLLISSGTFILKEETGRRAENRHIPEDI
jgi:hypothetical protein